MEFRAHKTPRPRPAIIFAVVQQGPSARQRLLLPLSPFLLPVHPSGGAIGFLREPLALLALQHYPTIFH